MAATQAAGAGMPVSANASPRPARRSFATTRVPAALLAHGHRTVAEIDAQPPHFRNLDLVGMTVAEAAAAAGQTITATKRWLNHNRYRWTDGIIIRAVALVDTSEMEIAARLAAAPPSSPCYRCGAARTCEHR